MDKRILKKIAKDWAGSILFACDMTSFQDLEEDGILTLEESEYILNQTHKIAKGITDNILGGSIETILEKYYTIE